MGGSSSFLREKSALGELAAQAEEEREAAAEELRRRGAPHTGRGLGCCWKTFPQPWGTRSLERTSSGFIRTSRTPTGARRS